jgi:hypothetical protein
VRNLDVKHKEYIQNSGDKMSFEITTSTENGELDWRIKLSQGNLNCTNLEWIKLAQYSVQKPASLLPVLNH